MHTFTETLGLAGGTCIAVVAGIIVLTLFFRGLSWLSGTGSAPDPLTVRGVLKRNAIVNVHMVGGKTFEQVRLVGCTNSHASKSHLPHDLNGMVVLEDDQRQQYLVRAKNIQMIVVAPRLEPT